MRSCCFYSPCFDWVLVALILLCVLWPYLPNMRHGGGNVLLHTHASSHENAERQHPYQHAMNQLEWISSFSHNESDLSLVRPPKIYYDRHLLYHVTDPHGCRYNCSFTERLEELDAGDIAVFSEPFFSVTTESMKEKGVFIAFESVESPVHMRRLSDNQLHQVDLFITYMPWSQVPYMYPMFLPTKQPKYPFNGNEIATLLARSNTHLLPQHHKRRKKLLAWMVSNANAKNNRWELAQLISQLVEVDVYGAMGMETPPGRDAFQWLSEHYKFYLAFENSNCKYYITEKATSNALRYGMVPVVLGARRKDYVSVLPPHSYINVDDFKSIRELSNYLLYLDNNDTAYAEYFAWRELGVIYVERRLDCRLCGFMHHLGAGLLTLKKYSPDRFVDPTQLCFYRELLPLM